VPQADAAAALNLTDLHPYRDLLAVVSGQFGHRRRARTVILIRPDGYIAAPGTTGK